MPKTAAHFQVKLGGDWKDYKDDEDKMMKRAFMAGFPECRFELRGQKYKYNFKNMKQINVDTGKERDIRPPHGWKQPSKPIVPAGRTMTISVPPGAPGKQIQVPHPDDKDQVITVSVPAKSRPGQAMLVPIPKLTPVAAGAPAAGGGGYSGGAPAAADGKKSGGWSTGAKVTAGVAGAGMVVGGAVLGMSVAEHGVEGTGDIIADAAGDAGAFISDAAADAGVTSALDSAGDALGDAGEHIGEFAGDAGDFILDSADAAGDFIMDLF